MSGVVDPGGGARAARAQGAARPAELILQPRRRLAAGGGRERRRRSTQIASLRARLAGDARGRVRRSAGERGGARGAAARRRRPTFSPALERLVWQASHDPDPRVHAVALVKLAAAVKEPGEKRTAMLEAARKFREAGDHRSAVRAYEKVVAIELRPRFEGQFR